jgi:hypothetical protein
MQSQFLARLDFSGVGGGSRQCVNRWLHWFGSPLTLTLSLGEREQPAASRSISQVCLAFAAFWLNGTESQEAARTFMRRRRILLLPKGEGRAEGEVRSRCAGRHPGATAIRERDCACPEFLEHAFHSENLNEYRSASRSTNRSRTVLPASLLTSGPPDHEMTRAISSPMISGLSARV